MCNLHKKLWRDFVSRKTVFGYFWNALCFHHPFPVFPGPNFALTLASFTCSVSTCFTPSPDSIEMTSVWQLFSLPVSKFIFIQKCISEPSYWKDSRKIWLKNYYHGSFLMLTYFYHSTAKVEEQPRKLEHVIKVAHICLHRDQPNLDTRSVIYCFTTL